VALSDSATSEVFADFFLTRLAALASREPCALPAADVPESFRPAAVLLPFWREGDGVRLLLTERSATLRAHSGQVSFPGGRVDLGDASHEAAALRETFEEVGIPPDAITVLGRLDDVWSGAHHHVAAFVGWLESPPSLVLSPDEVAAALVVDVEPLLEPSAIVATEHEYMGNPYVDHSIEGDWGKVTGMTADLVLELVQFLRGETSVRGAVRRAELLRYVASHPELLEGGLSPK
jgi:8-oxo-dGTP pyrophosphatase MutT (NUDIX family)